MDKPEAHILIVDDQPYNLQVTGRILQEQGYLISLATDGPSALALLEQQTPDLILLDVMMPGMDGFQVCREINEDESLKEVPVIFLTASSQSEDLVEGFKAGGVDYITKPFKKAELLIRVKNHLELAGSRKKILEMNQNRDKLYSIIAHDLRSPFSSIIQLIRTLSGGFLDPAGEDFKVILLELEKTTSASSILLDNLLEWSRSQTRDINFTPMLNQLSPVVEEVVQLLRSNAEHKGISLEVEVPEEILGYFDLVSIHTVLRNLLSNAIKFTPENGSIRISSGISPEGLEINVEDSGIGMSVEVIRKIMIKQEPHTTPGTKNERGSGLGLRMVKEFVEKNKGQLFIESTPGKGTRCRVMLPPENSQQNHE